MANLEIIQEENGNVSIIKLPSNLIDAVFPAFYWC